MNIVVPPAGPSRCLRHAWAALSCLRTLPPPHTHTQHNTNPYPGRRWYGTVVDGLAKLHALKDSPSNQKKKEGILQEISGPEE